MLLKDADISAKRVMLELARVAFSDIRKIFDETGQLLPIHALDSDSAAAIAGIEIEVRSERDGTELDLATGEMVPKWIDVRTVKVKRFNKDAALGILSKHFKLVSDESADGVNMLANVLADRLNQRKRLQVLQEVTDAPDRLSTEQPGAGREVSQPSNGRGSDERGQPVHWTQPLDEGG